MSGHTPEPWEVDSEDNGETGAERFKVYLIGADDGTGKWATIATTHSSDLIEIEEEWDDDENGPWLHRWDAQGEANAKRIVACVNALEGMNPDAVAKLVEAAKEAVINFAAIRATLADENWEGTPEHCSKLAGEAIVLLNTALANLAGEAAPPQKPEGNE